MLQVIRTIRQWDAFAPLITLKYKQQSLFKSAIGGFITILVILFFLFYTIEGLINIFELRLFEE